MIQLDLEIVESAKKRFADLQHRLLQQFDDKERHVEVLDKACENSKRSNFLILKTPERLFLGIPAIYLYIFKKIAK